MRIGIMVDYTSYLYRSVYYIRMASQIYSIFGRVDGNLTILFVTLASAFCIKLVLYNYYADINNYSGEIDGL